MSAERVQQEILSEPAFQVDGKYSETLALARLAQIGITPEKFRADIRTSLQNAELERAIGVSEFLTPTEIGRRLALEDEQREVRVALLPVDRFRSSAVPDEAALAAWYAKNGKSFETPESVSLQYAEGSLAQIEAGITVTDDDLQAFMPRTRTATSRRSAVGRATSCSRPKPTPTPRSRV